jgi:hypothetical protein
MKSEERHELQRNNLATFLNDLPGQARKHSSKLLLVLALIVLAVVLYNRRQAAQVEREQFVQASLGNAWTALNLLQQEESRPALGGVAANRQQRRTELVSQVQSAVQQVIDESDPEKDKARLANAWIVSGEMYWQLANAEPIAPSTQPTTQASTQPVAQTPEQYLEMAQKAYEKVLSDYADQRTAATVARFSLAAIAENRRNWPAAREQYKGIIEATTTPPAEKAMAEARIAKLDELSKPLLLVASTQPAGAGGDVPFDLSTLLGPNAPSLNPPGPIGPTPAATQPTTAPTTQP